MGAMDALFEMIYNNAVSIVGDPLYLGLLVLLFFVGFVLLQNLRLDGKVAILVPAGLLALSFMGGPLMVVIFGLIIAVIITFAFWRLNR